MSFTFGDQQTGQLNTCWCYSVFHIISKETHFKLATWAGLANWLPLTALRGGPPITNKQSRYHVRIACSAVLTTALRLRSSRRHATQRILRRLEEYTSLLSLQLATQCFLGNTSGGEGCYTQITDLFVMVAVLVVLVIIVLIKNVLV